MPKFYIDKLMVDIAFWNYECPVPNDAFVIFLNNIKSFKKKIKGVYKYKCPYCNEHFEDYNSRWFVKHIIEKHEDKIEYEK